MIGEWLAGLSPGQMEALRLLLVVTSVTLAFRWLLDVGNALIHRRCPGSSLCRVAWGEGDVCRVKR